MEHDKLKLSVIKGKLAVCRLPNDYHIPEWAAESSFFSITKTHDELSIVCNEEFVPEGILCERDWMGLRVEGPLDFSLIGILSSISSVLARRSISIFAISTYDTDYILVKSKDIENAKEALKEEGYIVVHNCIIE